MGQVRQDNVQIKLEIDGSQSRTELDNLTRKAQVLQDGMKLLKKGSEEYVAANKELSQVRGQMEVLRKEIGLTSLTSDQLRAKSRELNRELGQLAPNTESFLNKAQELADVDARLAQVCLEAKGVKDELANAGGGVLDFIKKAAGFVGIQLGIQAAVSGLKQLGAESIDAAAQGSDSIADMEKSLNLTTAGAKALRQQLEGTDTRTTQADLERIAVAGGQLGVAAADVDEFTQSVDQANVALGDEFSGGVEVVTKSIGWLQKLFKETADQKPDVAITKIGSALNALGADGSATAPVIAEFTARIGQLGDLSPEITEVLGLGAAFQELGLPADISSGGLSNILLTASKDAAGFGKQIGLTADEFTNLINTDPNEVLLRLAASLKGASNTEIVNTLDALGIKSQEATKVISLLATQTDLVRQKQALASAEFEKGTGLTDEFNKKNTNAAAEVAKAEKGFAQFRQELGELLIPIYIKFLQYAGLLLDVLKAVPSFVAQNKTAFGLLALAVLAFNAEQVKAQATTLRSLALQKLVALGVLTEVEGKYALITATELQARAQVGLNAALTANPIGIVITLLALFAFGLKQLYDRSESFRAAVDSLFVMLRPLGALLGSLGTALGPLVAQLGRLFGSFSAGKGPLELFGQIMALSVVLPLKLVVTNVQLAVDAFGILLETGKRVANFFGADFKIDNGAFDKFRQNTEANAKSILSTLAGQDGAQAKAAQTKRFDDYAAELNRRMSLAAEAQAKQKAQAQQAAADRKAQDTQNDEESLKARLANIKAALALVEAGSAEELRLKKRQVTTTRDIELLDAKKTAGDKKVLVAEALRDLRQLQDEYDKKTKDAAEKRAKEQADVEKKIAELKAAQLTDETEKKILQLQAAAEKEKATAKGTAEQIAEQKKLLDANLAVDVAELRRARAQKDAEEELSIEKQRNGLIVDQYQRRAAELRTAAAGELLKVLDTDRNAAEKRRLIQEKLQRDLVALETDRVEKQQRIADYILAIDDELAVRRAARRRQQLATAHKDTSAAAEAEKNARLEQLNDELLEELNSQDLNDAQKLARIRKFKEDEASIINEYDDAEMAKKMKAEEDLRDAKFAIAQTSVQLLADLSKAETDKELIRLDKSKKQRLAQLDAEYKAGRIAKDSYEAQKSAIEANYDAQTRRIRKEAAEKEKAYNVAQAIIAGTLAVIKLLDNPPAAIAAGIAAAAGVAKIIATPIPEFAKGGITGGQKSTWRDRVRRFATGGGINPVAGVPSVGQLHSGGIRMVDGATGQHLGEWERGEPYMILSRDTYANNRELVDALLDTSLHRGGAPVRRRDGGGFYADGGTPGGPLPSASGAAGAGSQDVVQAIGRIEQAVRELPSRQRIAWDGEDTANVEDALKERQQTRDGFSIR
ncbi:hypothetical protein Q5H92_10765 [Hymenobacter sp. M29]|uniref:Phage tail tape measure protein domain-containing protein n=1 Tax=Hymenobacter mellowenesis TaxID=3063995 RepID=A0ABT9AAH7_9BACT|nr:hypothetical protein [Hymenobacter sp. M29]MDO7846840.1 hypothetical protein [Hymenobacter sp. M29]